MSITYTAHGDPQNQVSIICFIVWRLTTHTMPAEY